MMQFPPPGQAPSKSSPLGWDCTSLMKMCLKSCFEILVVRENQDRIETLEINFIFLPSLYWRGAAGGQNLFTILQTENGRLVTSGEPLELTKAAQSSPHIMTNATKER